ncbi:3-dehydroquinate synthase [Candidatus Johnevansia muelleri]|uniref:3-dehydroquinate synthase n=1 Tax=Candidatus Johnevansia muelleri TaxID=1495769 RepID=A0A078KHQ2_9GAMM|nr:3-dehydroquinate synthase [Candidatus Evansia muelleri]
MQKNIMVELGNRSYPIYIGPDLIYKGYIYTPYISGDKVLIVTNKLIAYYYLERLKNQLREFDVYELILQEGESTKHIATVEKIWSILLIYKFNRSSTIIALGGGVIGDISGFAAASYQRGITFIQMPTTLLAQVDSSVGGKTGVNHFLGKNMIGAFWQPSLVIIDTQTLNTLSHRDISAGIAEVIKYGLIHDIAFFNWLEINMQHIRALNLYELNYIILKSCTIKSKIISEDETEKGKRALLNFGHTFGHAIENDQGYGNWLHGEAISVGMIMSAKISHARGIISDADINRIYDIIISAGLPIYPPLGMMTNKFIYIMRIDKKVLYGNKLRVILLKKIGNAIIDVNISENLLYNLIKNNI